MYAASFIKEGTNNDTYFHEDSQYYNREQNVKEKSTSDYFAGNKVGTKFRFVVRPNKSKDEKMTRFRKLGSPRRGGRLHTNLLSGTRPISHNVDR